MPAAKKVAKRSTRSSPMKLYQIRVIHRGHVVYKSETSEERIGRPRTRRATLDVGPGAIGTLYRVDRKHGNTFVPIFEVRCTHSGKKGTPALIAEDHTTPPKLPEG